MEKFIQFVNQRMQLSPEDIQQIKSLFETIQVPAKTQVVKEGQNTSLLYFVNSGILKGYKYQDGKIVVEHLVSTNSFVTSMDSFFHNNPSKETFETITDTQLLKISKSNLEKLKQANPSWGVLIETVSNENLQCKMQRLNDFQTLTAKERYLKFLKQSPDLVLNVSVEDMASYLGIAAPSLSRIRRQITI